MSDLMFSSIFIGDNGYKGYTYNNDSKFLDNLSQINIFIGKNNSGKSRFIRNLFSDEDFKFLSNILDHSTIHSTLKTFIVEFDELKTNSLNSLVELDEQIKKIKQHEILYLRKHNDFQIILKEFTAILNWFKNFTPLTGSNEEKAKALTVDTHYKLRKLIPDDNSVTSYKFDSIYIPTLRGLRPIQLASSDNKTFSDSVDNYLFRTKADYFKTKEDFADKIYTGLSLYKDLQKYSHGDSSERARVKNFQNFLSKTFFRNEEVELTPTYNKDVINVKIGNFEESIYNLGDGIQSLIILTGHNSLVQAMPFRARL